MATKASRKRQRNGPNQNHSAHDDAGAAAAVIAAAGSANEKETEDANDGTVVVVAGLSCTATIISWKGSINTAITVFEATDEQRQRLLEHVMNNDASVLTHRDVYGAALWPAARALAQHMIAHNVVRDQSVLELGCGVGLCSLVAARCGAGHVLATDYEPVTLQLLEQAGAVNQIDAQVLTTQQFDVCDARRPLPTCQVLLIADLLYQADTSRMVAQRVIEALHVHHARVLLATSPGRLGNVILLETLASFGVSGVDFATMAVQHHQATVNVFWLELDGRDFAWSDNVKMTAKDN